MVKDIKSKHKTVDQVFVPKIQFLWSAILMFSSAYPARLRPK